MESQLKSENTLKPLHHGLGCLFNSSLVTGDLGTMLFRGWWQGLPKLGRDAVDLLNVNVKQGLRAWL
jgi:hypothetical protein